MEDGRWKKEEQRKTSFPLVLCSLIRTFDPWSRFSYLKVKSVALHWLHLRKIQINLVFRSVCTTFAGYESDCRTTDDVFRTARGVVTTAVYGSEVRRGQWGVVKPYHAVVTG